MERPKPIHAGFESDDEDLSRDWLKLDHSVKNDGFRMGMEVSQEQSLQSGFNAGFREAIKMALAGGKLQGGICANLSYAPVTSSATSVQTDPLSHNVQSQVTCASSLQSLLTLNTYLISSIPGLLQNNISKNTSLKLKVPDITGECMEGSSAQCCQKKDPELVYLDILPETKESKCTAIDAVHGTSEQKGSQVQDQTQSLSCEHVCSSKSHFWSQLENFKMQAQSLGVLSSHD